MYLVFPIPAKYFVMIIGALAFYSSLSDTNGVANATHLGGLLVGYLYLKSARLRPLEEAKYWYLRWKMNRTRKKFGVYSGGRANDWDRRGSLITQACHSFPLSPAFPHPPRPLG